MFGVGDGVMVGVSVAVGTGVKVGVVVLVGELVWVGASVSTADGLGWLAPFSGVEATPGLQLVTRTIERMSAITIEERFSLNILSPMGRISPYFSI
jgi:hypothetical protein